MIFVACVRCGSTKSAKTASPSNIGPLGPGALGAPRGRARLHGVLRPSDARSTLLCADGDVHPASAHWSGRAPSSRALPVGGAGISV